MKKKFLTFTEDVLDEDPWCHDDVWPASADSEGCWYWAYSPDDDVMYQVYIDHKDPIDVEDRVREYV